MARVNPPRQLKLPKSVNDNPDLKKAFDDLNFIVFQLWQRTGAGDDFIQKERLQKLYKSVSEQDINELNIDLKSIYAQQQEADQNISYKTVIEEQHNNINLTHSEDEQVTLLVDTDLTTSQSMTLVCNNTGVIDITLNDTPDENETVTVKRVSTGLVNILSSKSIDSLGAQQLTTIYDSITMQFIAELNEWIITNKV